MDVSLKWWKKHGIFAETEEKVTIKAEFLTNVAYVKVIPPERRHQKNTDCHIYGHISFKVGDTEVTLFSRKRDDPDHRFLSNHVEGSRLSLSDHHESNPPRPLGAVSASYPLLVKMKLHEKKKGSEEKDVLISETEYYHSGGPDTDCCYFITVPGKNGFEFEVSYSIVFGARAKVDVTIKEGEGGGGGFPNGEVPFWGKISAHQFLEDLTPYYNKGESLTTLRNIYGGDRVNLKVGESIPLNRRFVVVPMRFQTYLGVRIAPVIDDKDREGGVSKSLYFPVRQFDEGTFFANKNLTHSKYFEHSSGLEFHVSIEFCPHEFPLVGACS